MCNGAQATLLDTFNRPDGPIGSHWTNEVGSCSVVSDQAYCSGAATGLGLATYNGGSGWSVAADVFNNGSSLEYVALVVGFADLSNNLFIKVQNNGGVGGPAFGGPGFNTYGLYFGQNGINNGAWSGSRFSALSSPFTSAHMIVSLAGTTLTLSLDTNFDTIPDQVYTADSVPIALLGTKVGIGLAAIEARIDNFDAIGEPVSPEPGPVPEPSTLALLGVGLVGLSGLRFRRKTTPLA
jgi:hypothetical protein